MRRQADALGIEGHRLAAQQAPEFGAEHFGHGDDAVAGPPVGPFHRQRVDGVVKIAQHRPQAIAEPRLVFRGVRLQLFLVPGLVKPVFLASGHCSGPQNETGEDKAVVGGGGKVGAKPRFILLRQPGYCAPPLRPGAPAI